MNGTGQSVQMFKISKSRTVEEQCFDLTAFTAIHKNRRQANA